MVQLKVYSESAELITQTANALEAKDLLSRVGIDYEFWFTKNLESYSEDEIMQLCAADIERIKTKHGFKSVDVVSMSPDIGDDELKPIREKFLAEHIHEDDEVRFFIDGSGLFFVHAGDRVYELLCERGDFVAVPANTKHWFDTGLKPNFKCIRFFTNEEGWLAKYTGDQIATLWQQVA